MMRTLRSTLIVLVAVTVLGLVLQPGVLSAQTSGVGADGLTRLLWRGTDGEISVWRLNANLSFNNFHAYGPYAGWKPIAITVGVQNNRTYVLWRHTGGSISLWWLDRALNFGAFHEYGPFSGWTAETLSVEPGTDNFRVIWKNTDGRASVWKLDANLNLLAAQEHGPFFGWNPGPTD
jgi:hypothetical protein